MTNLPSQSSNDLIEETESDDGDDDDDSVRDDEAVARNQLLKESKSVTVSGLWNILILRSN